MWCSLASILHCIVLSQVLYIVEGYFSVGFELRDIGKCFVDITLKQVSGMVRERLPIYLKNRTSFDNCVQVDARE